MGKEKGAFENTILLYQPTWITVAKAGLKGLWTQMPLSVNDLAAMCWQ
jgi:peptide/nickel transport system substrate-binding protein